MTYKRGNLTLELEPIGDGHLAWTCMLPLAATGVFNVAYHLLEQGYRNYTRHPLRLRLAHPMGHRVDILPAQRSIRIRLERHTHADARVRTALTVMDDICASVDDAQRTRTMW